MGVPLFDIFLIIINKMSQISPIKSCIIKSYNHDGIMPSKITEERICLTTNFYQATLLATTATKKYPMLPDVMEKPLLLSAARPLWKRLNLNCLRLSKALTLR